jgi:hypothetical protein
MLKLLVLVFFITNATSSLHARVFTTRPGEPASLDNPSSFGAKKIYGGQFRINGHAAQMDVLSGTHSISDTIRLFGPSTPSFRYRETKGAIVGRWTKTSPEKRVLLFSTPPSKTCLIFILNGDSELYTSPKSQIPWPSSLPILDPTQQPQLVVEHLDSDFIFACVSIPSPSPDRAIEFCRGQMIDAGWSIDNAAEKTENEMGTPGFAVLQKSGKVCWLQAQMGAASNQVLVTLLCKKP